MSPSLPTCSSRLPFEFLHTSLTWMLKWFRRPAVDTPGRPRSLTAPVNPHPDLHLEPGLLSRAPDPSCPCISKWVSAGLLSISGCTCVCRAAWPPQAVGPVSLHTVGVAADSWSLSPSHPPRLPAESVPVWLLLTTQSHPRPDRLALLSVSAPAGSGRL